MFCNLYTLCIDFGVIRNVRNANACRIEVIRIGVLRFVWRWCLIGKFSLLHQFLGLIIQHSLIYALMISLLTLLIYTRVCWVLYLSYELINLSLGYTMIFVALLCKWWTMIHLWNFIHNSICILFELFLLSI